MLKNQTSNVREAGRRLHASLLLAGSLLRSDERIRINVQLVRASDDTTLWAGKFDRDIKDIMEIQDEISHAIVNELRLKLDRENQRRYDIDIGTYEKYLRARSLSERKDRQNLRTAIAFYKEVVTAAPSFAPAQAMRDAIAAPLTGLRQGCHVPAIGFNAAAAVAIHRREIRLRHDHLMAERLQVLRDPLTLGRRLEQNAHAGRPRNTVVKRSRVVRIRRSTISPSSVRIRIWLSFL
jgi:hypothetical protein